MATGHHGSFQVIVVALKSRWHYRLYKLKGSLIIRWNSKWCTARRKQGSDWEVYCSTVWLNCFCPTEVTGPRNATFELKYRPACMSRPINEIDITIDHYYNMPIHQVSGVALPSSMREQLLNWQEQAHNKMINIYIFSLGRTNSTEWLLLRKRGP